MVSAAVLAEQLTHERVERRILQRDRLDHVADRVAAVSRVADEAVAADGDGHELRFAAAERDRPGVGIRRDGGVILIQGDVDRLPPEVTVTSMYSV